MDEDVLERTVQDFFEHRFDVLVCTTIVESGIDMPSVNTLIVDRADRLGLGQLHQLRGRVGRSGVRAYAYLFHPRGVVLSETALERLRCIGDNTALGSGFKIAMRDLEIRGAGSLLGHRQSGHVAAVGYDLYVQLVAEAVAEAKGVQLPSSRAVVLPRLGHAFLPESYIRAEDQRLEAYRRLTTSHSVEELQDVADEWRDRYGVLPPEAEELLRVMELRVACVEYGIDEVTTGVRHGTTFATVRASGLSPEFLVALQQRESVRSVDTATHVVTLAFDGVIDTVVPVTALVHELWSQRPSVA
jgi:transcription-repair coupling factor (superfamily II helicase)